VSASRPTSAWLVFRAEPQPQLATAVDLEPVLQELRNMRSQIARLQQSTVAVPATANNARTQMDEQGRTIPRDIESRLARVQGSLRRLEEAVARIPTPTTHSLEEIRRQYPTSNWQACKALIDKASRAAKQQRVELQNLSDAEAYVRVKDDVVFMKTLNTPMRMLTAKQVLDRFGAPTNISVSEHGFTWTYHSPEKTTGHAYQVFTVRFAHGYVSYVSVW
jgi:exonuclease VII large subunit